MLARWRQRVLAGFLVAVAALLACPAWAQDEGVGRPVHVDTDKRPDERPNRELKPSERKAKAEIDKALKEIDPRANPNGEFKGAEELENLIKADDLNREVRGLPPDGIHPPVDGKLEIRQASRPSEAKKGGKSLFDEAGGEWRYFPGDKYHNEHWDYNAHDKLYSEWQNISINGKPALKE